MTSVHLSLLLSLAAAGCAAAQDAPPRDRLSEFGFEGRNIATVQDADRLALSEFSDRLRDFEERESAWVVALRDADDVSTLRPMLEAMIADDFVYQHGSGRNLTKEAYIELLVTQGITVETLGPLELQIRDYGDVVISYGVSPMSGRVFYEFPYDGRLRFVNVWRFHDGRWRLHHRNSELLEE